MMSQGSKVGRGGRGGGWAEGIWAAGAIGALGVGVWLSACDKEDPPPAAGGAGAVRSPAGGEATAAAPAAVAPAGGDQGQEAPLGPQGWHVVYAAKGVPQVRSHAVAAAFALAEGESPDPQVSPDGFMAGYGGVIDIQAPGRYRFGATVEGGTVKLAGFDGAGTPLGEASGSTNVWTPWVNLPAKPVTLSIAFTRGGAGPARLRAMWEKEGVGTGFRAEPIPPAAVTVPAFGQRDAAAAASAFHGRVLLGELNCAACHDAGEAGAAMLAQRKAPLLGEIGRRASPEWLAAWVSDPQRIKPGSGMPDVIGESAEDKADADAIVHYLVSLGGPTQWQAAATEPQSLEIGRRLFHTVGCVACHGAQEPASAVFTDGTAPGAGSPAPEPPHPYGKLSGKWRPSALSEFLQDPLRTHPGGRMPSMSLKPSEADAIATYLVNVWGQNAGAGGSVFTIDPEKVSAGKAAFAARGCASCHQTGHNLPDIAPTLAAKPMNELRAVGGCLDAADTKTPRYTLGPREREDLAAGVEAVKRAIAAGTAWPAPTDRGHRLIAALGCRTCHERDAAGGPDDAIKTFFRTVDETELGDEGRLPPHITGVGTKLNTPWLKTVLTGGGRARPYMATRMPQFGDGAVGDLHLLLAAMDGVKPGSDEPEPEPTDQLVLAGRRLVGEKGMNCISCHTFNGKSAGTAGPDITGFAERLRYEWWKPYIISPTRFKPGTRMTEFYKDGRGPIADVLGGDPEQQSRAMWAYFNTGQFGPAPEGLPTGRGLPVTLGDKPAVFRTFLKSAGSRGIAVGYPIGTHFGFDATGVRLVDSWQGDFVDATSAWKGRGGEVAGGQGKVAWKAPPGPALVIGERPESWPAATGREAGFAFKGYKLDSQGVPTFMYRLGDAEVEERFEPAAELGSFRRTFWISGVPGGATVWLNTGPGVMESIALENVGQDESAGNDTLKLHGYTPIDPAKPIAFAVVIKP